jgi:pimeloyl-ACP methyl ester carboxylesterase
VTTGLKLAMALLIATGAAAGPDAREHARTPVLFVHGHGLSSADWQPLIAHLVASGYRRDYLHAVDIVPNTMANVQAAEAVLAPAATMLLARAKAAAQQAGYPAAAVQQIDIVAHSMGAVSSRWYAARMRPDLVRTWIALAGAHHGTNALCPLRDPASRELCPAFATDPRTHPLQLALNGTDGARLDETPYGLGLDRSDVRSVAADGGRRILYLTVRVEPDAWIQPERSASLNGAGGVPIPVPPGIPVKETSPGNFLFDVPGIGHDPLLQHPGLFRVITAMLAARDRGRTGPSPVRRTGS